MIEQKNALLSTQSVGPKIPNQGMKKSLSFRQTATSLKRANLATMGIQTHRTELAKREPLASSRKPVATVPARSAPVAPSNVKKPVGTIPSNSFVHKKPATAVPPRSTILKKPATGIPPAKQANLNRKLTLPQSPNFSSRLKERSAAKVLTAHTAGKVLPSISARPAATQAAASKVSQVKKETESQNTATWVNPLTPEARATPARILMAKSVAKTPLSPSTPKIKPFARKSFTDVKVRPSSSVSFRTGNNESKLSQSMWSLKKEPSEKYV